MNVKNADDATLTPPRRTGPSRNAAPLGGKIAKIKLKLYGTKVNKSPMALVKAQRKKSATYNLLCCGWILRAVSAKYAAIPESNEMYFFPPQTSLLNACKPIPPVNFAVNSTTAVRQNSGNVICGAETNRLSELKAR